MILQRIALILTFPRGRGCARLSAAMAAMKETTAVLEVTPNSVWAKQDGALHANHPADEHVGGHRQGDLTPVVRQVQVDLALVGCEGW